LEDASGEESEAEVGEDGGVASGVFGCGAVDLVDEVVLPCGVEDDLSDEVELHDLLGADEEALLFGDGFGCGDGSEVDAFGGESCAEVSRVVVIGECGDEDGLCAHGGEVSCDDGGAAVVVSALEWPEGHDGAFAGDFGVVAEDVGVADGLADDEDASVAEGGAARDECGAAEVVALGELPESCVEGIGGGLHGVDERGGGEDDVSGGEDDASAVGFDGVAFGVESRVVVVFVFASLDVDVGLDALEELGGGGLVVDVDPVDEVECGEVFGAELFGDEWAAGALGDAFVAGDGDEEDVAEGFGLAEVSDVSGVDDVEAAVALDECSSVAAGLSAPLEEVVEGEDFGGVVGVRGFAGRSGVHPTSIGRQRGVE